MDELIIRWVPRDYMKPGASYWASIVKTYPDDVEMALVPAAEIRRLCEQVRVAREALEEIAAPIEGTPVGDPWAFYRDVAHAATTALAQLAEPTEVDHGT